MYQKTYNNNQFIYQSEEGIVIKKTLKKELTVTEKLDKLKTQLEVIAKKYEENLRKQEISEEKIKCACNEYVEQTLRHYAINFTDTLDSVIAYCDNLINNIKLETEEQNCKKIK